MLARLLTACLLAALMLAGPAHAHERSRSHSVWRDAGERVDGYLIVDARRATLLLGAAPDGTTLLDALRQQVERGVSVARDGRSCARADGVRVQNIGEGRLRAETAWSCPSADGALAISVEVLSPYSANHIHFVRVRMRDGDWREAVLSGAAARAVFDEEAPANNTAGATALRHFVVGVEHILSGPDHLAFLAGLLLLVTGLRRLLAVTLGFTLGHSVTLGLAALGVIAPPGAAVESLIGFSILFVAAEAAGVLRSAGARAYLVFVALVVLGGVNVLSGGAIAWPVWAGLAVMAACYAAWLDAGGVGGSGAPLISTGFGLVHGVGFAGLLLETEISRETLLPALVGFNLGVEAGQVVMVATALAGAALLRRVAPDIVLVWARGGVLAILAGLGAFWFLSRAWS